MKNNIVNIIGDVLVENVQVVAHQVNVHGVMGGGIALALKKKYPAMFSEYVGYCEEKEYDPELLLGDCQLVQVEDGKSIANLFGQNPFGWGEVLTNYDALETSLFELRVAMENTGLVSLGVPKFLGCGIAGGDWSIVSQLITKVFQDSNILVKIVELK